MQKILLSLILASVAQISFGQEAADKKFQGGLVAGFGMNFQNMGTKYVEKDGVGTDMLIGGNLNYMFNETIGLTTGLEFEFSTTKFKSGVGNRQLYYYYNDSKIIGVEDFDADPNAAKSLYKLNERRQKSTYLTVPTMLIFRTKFIGYFRYFGKFGMRHSFLLGQKSHDTGESLDFSANVPVYQLVDNKAMKASNEVVFYKGSVGIAGGAEWNFTGTTCLMLEVGYYYGITPLYYNRDNAYMHVLEPDNSGAIVRTNVSNKATQGQLQFKVSVLF